jgi:hypothetical protein
MHQHPALSRALVRDRVIELRRSGQAGPRIGRDQRQNRVSDAARRRTGWLLVEVGLRLAVPRNAMTRPGTRRQR